MFAAHRHRRMPKAILFWSLRSTSTMSVMFDRVNLSPQSKTYIMISYSLCCANLAPSCLNAAISESILDLANLPLRSCLRVSATAKLGSKTSSTLSPSLRRSMPTIVIECPGLWKYIGAICVMREVPFSVACSRPEMKYASTKSSSCACADGAFGFDEVLKDSAVTGWPR